MNLKRQQWNVITIMTIAHTVGTSYWIKGGIMASPIIKGNLYIPEQKKVPKIPEGMGMIQPAADVVFKPMIET